ncbi:hypothetical protein CIW47_18235 [Mycolicibacterium sp. P1-5]|nr:hypothetical protein CIW47_18235 [Mycolicibacterium sp. P1-5]
MERMATAAPARPRRPRIATLRMQLKPAHQACGYVQGAWWPRSTLLIPELAPLLAALTSRFGPIDRVQYHEDDWGPVPQHVEHPDGTILLESNGGPNVISVTGAQFGTLTLLVVPPYTDASLAYNVVMAAANAFDSSTPEQLLLGTGIHPTTDTTNAAVALHRWEADGGALCQTT